MSNIALQIERISSGAVSAGQNVVFDSIVYSSGNISYNSVTGVITFNESGRYTINWWVSTQIATAASGILFTLSSSQGDLLEGNSPIKAGETVGMGIIDVTTGPVTASLVNSSTGDYYYAAQFPIKATLVIVQDDLIETVNARCLAVAQVTNILEQMISVYSTTTWTVYTESLYSFSGQPLELYASPNASGPGLLRLIDVNGDFEALSIEHIAAIYPGDGTVYDPSFTYLPAPDPLPDNCDANMLASIQSYLPIGTTVDAISLGPSVSASGDVYRNEYGLLVLSDTDGNTPVFIASLQILRIFLAGSAQASPLLGEKGTTPSIGIVKP